MIKAIITDVDGVIVGKKHGVNFPLPNRAVIEKLKALRRRGIPIVLCTAKFNHAIKEIILQAELRNPHITDGGALIIDPLNGKIIKKHVFDKEVAKKIVSALIAHEFYTEAYGASEYYLQKDHISEFTEKRIQILQKKHTTVNSLQDHIPEVEVIKIISFVHNQKDKEKQDEILEQFSDRVNIIWSKHPLTAPSQNAIITVKGVSKGKAAKDVLKYLGISPEEVLGIGDLLPDWDFISICKYGATVGNESLKLKELVRTKGKGNYFYGSSVDEDGFLEIINHFNFYQGEERPPRLREH